MNAEISTCEEIQVLLQFQLLTQAAQLILPIATVQTTQTSTVNQPE